MSDIPKDICTGAARIRDILKRECNWDTMADRIARALLAERMAERERLAERLDAAADSFDAAAIHDADLSRVAAHRACEKLCNSLARSIRNQEKL
jgi:hypothetical protein